MGHHIYWDNDEKSVLFHQFISPASKDDFIQLAQKSAVILQKVDYTVHLIIDDRPVNHVYDSGDIAYIT